MNWLDSGPPHPGCLIWLGPEADDIDAGWSYNGTVHRIFFPANALTVKGKRQKIVKGHISVQSNSFIRPDRPAVKRTGLWLRRPLAWRFSP